MARARGAGPLAHGFVAQERIGRVHLREGIGLRAYGQRNPLVEYKRESYALFEDMWERIEDHVVKFLFHAEPVEGMELKRRGVNTTLSHPDAPDLAKSHAQQERAANTPVAESRPSTSVVLP